jgi:hypothetical protein
VRCPPQFGFVDLDRRDQEVAVVRPRS